LTTTDPKAGGPFTEPITIGLYFGPGRETVKIIDFPPVVTDPYLTDVGTNVTTVTLASGGSGNTNPTTGVITLGATLKFDHSIDLPFYEEDSTLSLPLTTGTSGNMTGSPVNQSTGAVTLVGSGTFKDGYLGGKTGRVTITGTITPIP
jgi:hypothetical protein